MNQKKYFLGAAFAAVLLSGVIVFASPILRGSVRLIAFENGFDCAPKGTVASFVCAKNGRSAPPDVEVTYFNSCIAQEHGAEIIHEGVCEGQVPCGDSADPVCGNDGNTWISACYAEEQGGGVQYEGACEGQSDGELSGPGGCTTIEECMQYCADSDHVQECQEYCETYPDACKDMQSPTDGDVGDDENDDSPYGDDPFQDFDPDDFGDQYFGPDVGDHGMHGPDFGGSDRGQDFSDAKEIARQALDLILENMDKLSAEYQSQLDVVTLQLTRIRSDQFSEAGDLLEQAQEVFQAAGVLDVVGGRGGPPMEDMMGAIRAGIEVLAPYLDPSDVEEALRMIDEIVEACSSGDWNHCGDVAGGMEDFMMDLTMNAHRSAEAEDGKDAAVDLCIDFMTVMEPVINDPMVFANGVEFACEMFGKMGWDPHAMDNGGGQGGDYGNYSGDYGGGDYGGDYGGDFGGSGGFGPGGCTNEQECRSFCETHLDECGGGDYGGFGGNFGGFSGGDHGAEECVKQGGRWDGKKCNFPDYCETHPNECGGGDHGGNYGGGDNGGDVQSCVQPQGLIVSWWNGDMVSGTAVPDGSDVHRNDGKIFGGVTVVPMENGKAFEFDGSSGYINMGNPESLNFGGPFSLEVWVNWDGGGSQVNNIIRKSNYPVNGPGAGYWLRIGRDTKTLEFSVGSTTGPDGQSLIAAPISVGVWHHVVATRDSSDNVKLYIDGQSTGTVLRQAQNAKAISEAPFTLGAWNDRFGVTEFFSGGIDEVSVYTSALDASQVQDAFNAGSTRKCTSSSHQR